MIMICNHNLVSNRWYTYGQDKCFHIKDNELSYELARMVVCNFIYSCIKIYCLTELEQINSKYLFQKFLNLSHMSSHMFIHGINTIKNWLNENAILNKYCYAFLEYKSSIYIKNQQHH